MSQFFASGGQNIGVSVSASVLSMNIQDRFPLGWTGWILLQPRDSQESSPTPQFQSTVTKHDFVISFNLEQSAFSLTLLKTAGL